jgi:hypothetical protein
VTNNVPDFESLRRAREAAGTEVPGLIYTSDLTFPRTKAYVSRLGAALAAAAAGRETARCGGVLWLRPARVISEGVAQGRQHNGCHDDTPSDMMAEIRHVS